MEKFLLSFLMSLLLLLPARAADPTTWTWNYNKDTSKATITGNQSQSGTVKVNDVTWTVASESNLKIENNGTFLGVGFGGKTSGKEYFSKNFSLQTDFFKGKTIESISFGVGSSKAEMTVNLLIDGDNVKSYTIPASSANSSNKKTVEYKIPTLCKSAISFQFTSPSTPTAQVNWGPVSITYSDGTVTKKDVTLTAMGNAPELEAGGDAISFDKFVTATVEGDAELSAKAQQGVYITTTNEADKEYVEIANGKIKGLKETTSPITLAATFPGSDTDNLNASNTLQFSVKVVPLKKVEALLELDAMPERISVGESFQVTFTVEPDEAADYAVVKTTDESIKAEKKEGVWTLTGVSVNDSAVYTVNFPEDSKYYLEAPEEGVIEVIPGAVISTPAADEQSKITIKRGESVTFTSAGADKLLIEDADGNTETVSNPYTCSFDKPDEYIVTITPGYGDKLYDDNGTNYGISAIYNIVVEANPLCGEVVIFPESGEVAFGSEITISCENAVKIIYTVDGGDEVVTEGKRAVYIFEKDCTIEAWGVNADGIESTKVTGRYTLLPEVLNGRTEYQLVTKQDEVVAGAEYIITATIDITDEPTGKVTTKAIAKESTNDQTSKYRNGLDIEIIDGNLITELGDNTQVFKLANSVTVDGTFDIYTDDNHCLSAKQVTENPTSNANELHTVSSTETGDFTAAKIYINDSIKGTATIEFSFNKDYNKVGRYFIYNNNNGINRFTNYTTEHNNKNGEKEKDYYDLRLFRKVEVAPVKMFDENGKHHVGDVMTSDKITFTSDEGVDVYYRLVQADEISSRRNVTTANRNDKTFTLYEPNSTIALYDYANNKRLAEAIEYYGQKGGAMTPVTRVNVSVETGVEGIEAEGNGEVEYFNLQGVKVQNPEKGIYIRVQDGKAVKIVK